MLVTRGYNFFGGFANLAALLGISVIGRLCKLIWSIQNALSISSEENDHNLNLLNNVVTLFDFE